MRRTANKSRRMNEDPAVDSGRLREFFIPEPSPSLRQGLPAFETVRRDRDGLNPPGASRLVGVNDIDRLRLINHAQFRLQLKQVFLYTDRNDQGCDRHTGSVLCYTWTSAGNKDEEGRKLTRMDTKDSLSKERIVRRGLFSHADPVESAARGHQPPRFEPAARLLRSSPDALGTLPLPTWTLSQISPGRAHIEGEDHQAGDAVGNISHIHSLRAERFIPGRIQPTHSCGEICSIAVLGGDIPRVLGNTVIYSVNRFNKFLHSHLSAEAPELNNRKDTPCIV